MTAVRVITSSDASDSLGAVPWADRARAAEGLSNREIGERLPD